MSIARMTFAAAIALLIGLWAAPAGASTTASLSASALNFGALQAGTTTTQSRTLAASFTPEAEGTQSATLVFSDDGPGSPQAVNLTEVGTAAGAEIATDTLAPSPMAFEQALNNSVERNLTITNTSTAESPIPLYISSLALSDAVDFGIAANGCPMYPQSLNAGQRCNVAVNFAPQSTGTINGTLTIANNTSDGTPPGTEQVALNGTTSACPIGDRLGPTPPRASPFLLDKGQDTLVTVTSVVPPDPNLISGSVTLLRLDSSGNVIANLGVMYDDGTHGDVQAGDGMYTTQVTFNDPVAPGELTGRRTLVYLAVQASYSGAPGCRQSNRNDREISEARPVTPDEYQAYSNALSAGGKFYHAEIMNGVEPEQARQDTIQFLLQQPGVIGAYEGQPSNSISVGMSSGLMGIISVQLDSTMGGGGSFLTTTRAYLSGCGKMAE
ncbi:MAG: choice-of-anchor D domain-containing protein [Candidatus Binataceae bacterium]